MEFDPDARLGDQTHVLRGWKDVAAYLNLSVRTAQRMAEQLGLPVHRTGHAKGGVTAYREELDAWVKAKGAIIQSVEDDLSTLAGTAVGDRRWPTVQLVSSRAFLAALGLVMLIGVTVAFLWGFSPAAPVAPADRASAAAGSRDTPLPTLPTTFRLRARMRGRDPIEFQATEGVPSIVEVAGAAPVFVEPQVRGNSLHVVLYERSRNAPGAALTVTASADLKPASSRGEVPVRFLLDDGWLELAWLDAVPDGTP